MAPTPARYPLVACALVWTGCVGVPTQDPAGSPARALPYALGERLAERVECRSGDCEDWLAFDVAEPGYLIVVLEAQGGELEIGVTDEDADLLATARTRDGTLQQRWIMTPTPHFFRIRSAGGDARTTYTLETSFAARVARESPGRIDEPRRVEEPRPEPTARPAPPAPPTPPAPPAPPDPSPTRPVEALLIGIEGADALLGEGSSRGLRPGLRGRIVDGDRTLASFEIIDVFPEGSRARLDGAPSAPPGPAARAIVEIPVER